MCPATEKGLDILRDKILDFSTEKLKKIAMVMKKVRN